MDHEQGPRPADPAVAAGSRRSRILGGDGGARSIAIATVSTIVFFGAIAAIIVTSPGWPEVRRAFFDPEVFADSFPGIAEAFLLNIRIFMIAEPIILVFGLLLAVIRSPRPGLLPGAGGGRVHRHLPRGAVAPRDLDARVRRAGTADLRRADHPSSGAGLPHPHLLRVPGGGVPGGDRVGAREPGAAARSLGLPRRRCASWCCRRRCGGWSRRR